MEKHYVGSEIGQLRSVMLHRPNLSLKRLTPSNCQELLFDDVLSVERAGEEHDIFANTLRQQGIEVLLLTDLLTQTLDVQDAKDWLLETQISDYRLGPAFATDIRAWLADMQHRELARHLSGGLTYGEIPASIKNMVVDTHDINDFIMKPLPNHLFTRDTSCWIYNGVSINPMAKPARQRETNNLRAIYRWHPAFADGDFIKYFGDENINYDHATLEGGDVLVIGRGAVLIGMSERTTPQGVEFLANSLFKHRQAERVIAVELPKHRSCMHLDTVMTHIDVDTFSVYPEVVRKDAQCWTLTPDGRGGLLRTQETDLLHAIEKALGPVPLIAEDLGVQTDEVKKLLEESGFPGMRVLIFGFTPDYDNEHLPHNYKPNSIVYTSTHDSQTVCEQIMDICSEPEKQFAYRYLRTSHAEAMGWSAIKCVWASSANIAMTTLQDLLSLGADSRMNTPATIGGKNWRWRVRAEALNPTVSSMLGEITKTYMRG